MRSYLKYWIQWGTSYCGLLFRVEIGSSRCLQPHRTWLCITSLSGHRVFAVIENPSVFCPDLAQKAATALDLPSRGLTGPAVVSIPLTASASYSTTDQMTTSNKAPTSPDHTSNISEEVRSQLGVRYQDEPAR